ncbi:uncharacterized protein LOC144014987 [Festucalex cinctus]
MVEEGRHDLLKKLTLQNCFKKFSTTSVATKDNIGESDSETDSQPDSSSDDEYNYESTRIHWMNGHNQDVRNRIRTANPPLIPQKSAKIVHLAPNVCPLQLLGQRERGARSSIAPTRSKKKGQMLTDLKRAGNQQYFHSQQPQDPRALQ